MMKRSRVDEVQYGTRPGPGGVGGSGGGGGGGGGGVAVSAVGTTVTIGTGTGTIAGAIPSSHVSSGNLSVGITTSSAIAHHRILTPQHGGAQTIAYLPSTTPVAVSVAANSTGNTNKTVDTATTGNNNNNANNNATSIHHLSTAAGATSVVSSVGSVPAMQYSTSYVTTIPTNNTIKSTADGNVQLASSVSTTIQQSPTLQNQNNLRTRAVTPANNQQQQQQQPQQQQQQQQQQQSAVQNSISGISQPLITSTQQTQSQSQPQAQIVSVTPHIAGVPVSGSGGSSQVVATSTPLAQQTVAPPRLKVEDALSYLDQVKFQYADQPQIYNNFLDIMKEFKSQCIDTPGVIQRVSTLFKGHTELIYGFNMFLPPGYKIEIHSDELGCSVPVVSMPSPTGAFSSATLHAANMTATTTAASTASNLQNTLTKSSSGAVNLMTHGGTSLPQTTIHALQAPTAAQVACTNAGATTITASGGAQVSVVSTATNVPQSVTMAPVIATHLPQNYSRDRAEGRIGGGGGGGAQASPVAAVSGHTNEINTQHTTSSGGQHNLHHIQQAHQSILLGETAAAAGGVIAGQGNQPVEFNHAITYVNKIKLRFQNQPEKYKKFLEILHTYQKEQKVIKEGAPNQTKTLTEQEVYTQVAKLFGQDEDLLREFGQFLPDATNHHHGNAINAQHAAYTNAKAGADYKTGRSGATTVIGHSTALSGGAHITMSTAAPTNSALHLAGGTTLAQIGSTAGSHAAALGNLSSVNTSVSIKPFTNSTTPVGGPHNVSNHVMHNVSNVAGRGNDIIYDKKEHYQHTNVSGTTIHLAHHGANAVPNSAGLTMTPPSGTTIRASNIYEKDGSVSLHRTNNHIADAQKYNQIAHGHAAITPLKQKSSPGSGAYGSQAVISVGSVSGNMGTGITRANLGGTSINYVSPQVTSSHHHIAGQRRSLNSSMEDNSSLGVGPPPSKRHKPIYRDVSFSEASRKCTISDAAFFDKVRKALRSPEVYDNFLRCLTLFNQEIVSKTELLHLVTPFLNKFPDLLRWFTDFLGPPVSQVTGSSSHSGSSSHHNMEGIPLQALHRQNQAHNIGNLVVDRQGSGQQNELSTVQEIDLSSCKRLGASYCALPQSTIPKKCSGRTQLCREVLNDKWVSFPTWASEDSTFVTSRKTQFEETIYRTEDERFELDVVIETNSATIRVLEGVQKKLSRLPPEELSRFQLDDCLGGTSQTIHQRAIHRIYGDKAAEIIQGLKKNPAIAVPIILKRLKVKEEEWRNAQKGFNKVWREQNEKYYLKSLDHQAIFFKPNDMKALRSKSLFNEIETIYDERHEQDEHESVSGPHLNLPYKDKTILDDAANLLIHHVKRQTSIQKQEKTKIKAILRQFVPDLFFSRRQPLSDDEREEDSDPNKMDVDVPISRHGKSNQTSSSSTNTETSDTKDNCSTTIDNPSSTSAVSTTVSNSTEDKSNLLLTAMEASTNMTANQTAEAKLDELPTTSKAAMAAAAAITTQTAPTTGTNSSTTSTISTTAIKVEIKQESPEVADISAEIPLPPHALSNHMDEAYTLFFGNNNWYLFFRLHAILCERLHTMYKRAQILIAEEEQYKRTRRESTAMALRLKMKSDIQVEDFYSTFIDMLKNVLDGNTDTNTFEDSMREMFGIHAYISFTLDKVVSNAVRQLQNCVTEKSALECVELFHAEQRHGGAGGFCRNARKNYAAELAYQRKAEANLRDENCFKIFIYKIDCRVTIELLDTDSDESEKQTLNKAKSWNKYLDRLTNPAANVGTSPVITNSSTTTTTNASSGNAEVKVENAEEETTEAHSSRKPRFLDRNKRRACLRAEQAATRLLQNHNNKNLTNTGSEVTNNSLNKTTASSAATSTNAENADSICKVFGAVNKRLPERVGSLPGTTEKYIISDRDEVKLNASGRQVFVINKNLKFFKLASVRRAKKSHPAVTKQKYMNFQKFIKTWLSQNVSELQQQQCQDWLLGKQTNEITNKQKSSTNSTNWSVLTKVILQQDNNRTPYRTYNRYKLYNNNNNNNINTPITGTSNKDIITNQTNLSNNSDILKGNSGNTALLNSADNNSKNNNSTENITKNSEIQTTTNANNNKMETSTTVKSNATSSLAASNIISDTTSAISGSSNLSNNPTTTTTSLTPATLSQQTQPTSSGRPVES